jgi:hypothetical protein
MNSEVFRWFDRSHRRLPKTLTTGNLWMTFEEKLNGYLKSFLL